MKPTGQVQIMRPEKMSNPSGHTDNSNPSGRREPFDAFPEEDRETVREIWELSSEASSSQTIVSEEEVEQALQQTHDRLGWRESVSNGSRGPIWRWAAAAALLAIMLGAGWLIYPRTISAPYGEMITHTLPDGSVVELNSGSSLWYNGLYSRIHRSVSLDGEAFFRIDESDHAFVVQANNTIVRVTGTQFNVRSWSGEPGAHTELAVSEGSVRFYPDAYPDSSVLVNAGMASSWSVGMQAPSAPRPVSSERIAGWRNHRLVFNNKSLGIIVKELERRFDVRITLENTELSKELLTAYYDQPKGVESVIEDICRVKGLRYSKSAGGFRIYR